MDNDNIEIIVELGNWQTPGKATRWKWQVRQKDPPKSLIRGSATGTERMAQDAAEAARTKFLARIAM